LGTSAGSSPSFKEEKPTAMESIGARMGATHLGQKTHYLQDTTQHIIPAGKVTTVDGDSTHRCLQYEERPQTPPEVRRYRQSVVHEPGQRVRHPGMALDDVKQGPFGRPTIQPDDEKVDKCIRQLPDSEFMQWKQAKEEEIYASTHREPLGKSMLRGHKIPQDLAQDGFGRKVNAQYLNSIGQAHGIIFPGEGAVEEDPATKELYIRTHGDYDPGQQRRRGYNWNAANIDPATHAFGITEKSVLLDGVAKAMNPDLDSETTGKTHIVTKALADFKITNSDRLGAPKSMGHGDRGLPETHTFGKPTRTFVEWDAGRLLGGDYSEAEQAADADLGRSLRPGYRNVAPDNKVFGVPSIRTDLPNPKARSVADNQNYGNEPSAMHLLTPGVGADMGVGEEQYAMLRGKEEVRELVDMAGVQFDDDEEFDAAFDIAAQFCGSVDMCSVEALLQARQNVLRKASGLM